MLIEKRKFGFGSKTGFISLTTGFQIYFLSFSSRKLHENYQVSDKNNSHICLKLSVYKTFHQTVKHGHQINRILQASTGLENFNFYEGQ